ncbi:triose-phosphate isomerase [Moraxella nasovis]|uniref:triose-phosphate isomerase n=1 Tax=Moraxella nasovis TaxID=2904121 RepID=UPI001F60A77B|nr:triose-phosphate isomerase [Moraxella nasovis]UNU72588.1 triose-phosphate isomerase [Moraxella nasovis]
MKSTKYVIGNWKLNPATLADAKALSDELQSSLSANLSCVLGIASGFLHFNTVRASLNDVLVGAQDITHKTGDTGAFTGDVSAKQLADMGADFVLVGHSERRQYHGETSDILIKKIAHALQNNLSVVFCIGETKDEYSRQQTLDVLSRQLDILATFSGEEPPQNALPKILIAYEPVWAIGTGLTPTLDEIASVHEFIANKLSKMGLKAPILYGGSANENNAKELACVSGVDGVLVGGASLKATSFCKIAEAFSAAC